MSKEAMKLALEALETITVDVKTTPTAYEAQRQAITTLREALAEQPAQPDNTCNNALRIQGKAYPRTCKKCGLGPCVELAQQALDRKAENARELGLDYEPSAGTQVSKVWWDGDRLMAKPIPFVEFYKPAQQEPVACVQDLDEVKRKHLVYEKGMDWKDPLYTSPPAQRKPLTPDQIEPIAIDVLGYGALREQDMELFTQSVRAIEAAHGIKEDT